MRVQVEQRKENLLLNREEITFTVKEANITPSRKQLREQIAAQTNAKEKNLVVDVLITHFGSTDLRGKARIYKNEEDLKKTELKYIITRNFGKEEKKGEAKAEPVQPKADASPPQAGGGKEEAKSKAPAEAKGEGKKEKPSEAKTHAKAEAKKE